ncbi:hypothetical protein KIN20_030561 [Parelaphostrongylus tenuis]|uniref:Uncharacterized protein n=1 Tax=Parelaphostrongylus tenuis TaxID=148309 RepID=A0AAD5WGY8_PARTN|nr:hypothetical protein KIN20_030561 [Parelaphostrongylus tenuis]
MAASRPVGKQGMEPDMLAQDDSGVASPRKVASIVRRCRLPINAGPKKKFSVKFIAHLPVLFFVFDYRRKSRANTVRAERTALSPFLTLIHMYKERKDATRANGMRRQCICSFQTDDYKTNSSFSKFPVSTTAALKKVTSSEESTIKAHVFPRPARLCSGGREIGKSIVKLRFRRHVGRSGRSRKCKVNQYWSNSYSLG